MRISFEMEFKDNLELGNFMYEIFENYIDNLRSIRKIEEIDKMKPTEDRNPYLCMFDKNCSGWTKDADYNVMFLTHQERYLNDLLKRRGHLFLNEVYDALNMPRTKDGAVYGWIYDPDNPIGDNYVDFGLRDSVNKDFINGYTPNARLIFNVDGYIVNRI